MGGHQNFTNTKAITNARLNEKTVAPRGAFIGRDSKGYPNGQFSDFSANWGPSVPEKPDADYLSTVADYKNANRVGITMMLHPGGSVESLKNDPHKYVKGVVREGNKIYSDAGIRLKGSGSFHPIEKRPSPWVRPLLFGYVAN